MESLLGYPTQCIFSLLRDDEESIGLEQFREVVAADLTGFLIKLQIVVSGINKDVLCARARIGSQGLEEVLIEIWPVALDMAELIELEVQVRTLP